MKTNVVVLMSQLSDYMLHCFMCWTQQSPVRLFIFRKKVDEREAPFHFNENIENIVFCNVDDYPNEVLRHRVDEIAPRLIICFGWSNKSYLDIVSRRGEEVNAVLTMDNQWRGTVKQVLGLIYGHFYLKNVFDYIWVPGAPQIYFASLLGFQKNNVFDGLYVANSDNFPSLISASHTVFKKRFVFSGRYVEYKGVIDLWTAFVQFQEDEPSDWELVCMGTGPLFESAPIHPKIRHLGFVQPGDIKSHLLGGGVFVLPSHHEPWGVVVHEFALMGFPLIVSDVVGARSAFVNETNGVVIQHENVESLKSSFKLMNALSDSKLLQMSMNSVALGRGINVAKWVSTANRFLEY